ncbi:hypothetical protein AB0J14_04880 [Micromonospora arborensis]|uniref:hypothetical protein n=1 Tax=Micromonospora arborensis TaxID=2116518 RepID=UPI0034016A80
MVKTEQRTAPAPRPTPSPGQRPGVPAGAFRMSKTWVDHAGLPHVTTYAVPVDDSDRKTEHVRHACPGFIELAGVKQECDQIRWVLPGEKAGFCPDHGAPLAPAARPKRQGVPWAKVWDVADERIRVAAVTAAVAGAGVWLDCAEEMPWWGDLAQVTSLPAVVASSWWLTRWHLNRQDVKHNRVDPDDEVAGKRARRLTAKRARIAGYSAAIGSLWFGSADLFDGFTGGSTLGTVLWLAALGGGAVVASRPYLRHVDGTPKTTPEPVEPTAAPDAGEAPDANAVADADDWNAIVAVNGGLPNTFVDVDTWKADPGGRRMVIRNRGRGGALTEERLRQALPLMSGAFDVPRSAIGWIENFGDSPNAAELLVQPNSPLNEVIPGEPIDIVDIKKAVVHMGRRIDGTPLVTRMFTPGWGSPSRAIFGTKGSGKTELVRRLMLAQVRTRIMGPNGPIRLVAPFGHDPKRGADYGAFRRQLCGFSIDSSTLHMIVDAFASEMDRRYDALAGQVWRDDKGRLREGEKPFDPTIMGPILALDMDEFHVDAKDQALMAKLDPFARKMRAAGIELNIATHAATIGDTGSQGFRDMLAGGESWLLRTTMGLNAALATGGTLNGDPRLLPRAPGMVLQASGEDTTMQARIAYDDGEAMYDMLYDDDNNSRIQPIEWLPETLEAFGRDFVQWMRDSQQRKVGSVAVSAPASYKPVNAAAEAADDQRAADMLLVILGTAGKPLDRAAIMADSRWVWSIKQLSNCLKSGREAQPALLRKVEGSRGDYELTDAGLARDELNRQRREAGQAEAVVEAAEAGL